MRNSFEGRNSLGKLLNCFPELDLLVPKWGSIPAAHPGLIAQQCTGRRMLPGAGMCTLDVFPLCTSLLTAASVSVGLNLRDCLQLYFSLPSFKTKTTTHGTASYTRLQHPVTGTGLKQEVLVMFRAEADGRVKPLITSYTTCIQDDTFTTCECNISFSVLQANCFWLQFHSFCSESRIPTGFLPRSYYLVISL